MVALLAATCGFSQTESAFTDSDGEIKKGLLDPSRFDIHHAMSFGMSSSQNSSLKSQSLYSTMIRYQVAEPVTLNLNFSLPLHSTWSSSRNLTPENIQSLDYFKSMPFDATLSIRPRDNMLIRFSVVKRHYEDYYSPFYDRGFLLDDW